MMVPMIPLGAAAHPGSVPRSDAACQRSESSRCTTKGETPPITRCFATEPLAQPPLRVPVHRGAGRASPGPPIVSFGSAGRPTNPTGVRAVLRRSPLAPRAAGNGHPDARSQHWSAGCRLQIASACRRGRHNWWITQSRSRRSPRQSGVRVSGSMETPSRSSRALTGANGRPVQSGSAGASGSGRPSGRMNSTFPAASSVTRNPSS